MQKYNQTHFISMRHYPKAMTVATAASVWKAFPVEVKNTLLSPFRSDTDITITMLYPLYVLATQQGVLRPINGLQQLVDFCKKRLAHVGASLNDDTFNKKLAMITRFKPLTFCLNDAPSASEADRAHMQDFLQAYFPDTCIFEKR